MTDVTQVHIKVEGLAVGGTMIGTVIQGAPGQTGKKAFVNATMPGEVVIAEVLKEARGFIETRLLSIVEMSPDRIEPPCPYFHECGGCQLQHIPVAMQRELKTQMVESTLRVRRTPPRDGVCLAADPLPDTHYRNRVTLHLAPENKIGFYQQGTGSVVSIKHCLIASTRINEGIEKVQSLSDALCSRVPSLILEEAQNGLVAVCKLPDSAPKKDIAIVRTAMESAFPWFEIRRGRSTVFRSDHSGEESYGHFSQINNAGNSVLIETVLDWIEGTEVDDLYAGSGNFTFPIAARGAVVRAVEFDQRLVSHGRALATELDLADSVEFIESSCERFTRKNTLKETVLLDPPRAGAKDVVRWIDPTLTRQIVYVSCSLPTFARDAGVLKEKGFELLETRVVDMFPHTHHVELVSLFKLA